MKYVIYQITNTINNKIYIGKHKTKDINDGYMGSGKHLKHAQSKYGLENFKKEILHICLDEHDMNIKEAELVTPEFCLREDTYNICPGGQGGWGYINNAGLNNINKDYDKLSKALTGRKSPWTTDRLKALHKSGNFKYDTFSGKTHSEKTKSLISCKLKHRLSNPENNSQFGTMWITNGNDNKKIKSVDIIPEGWYKGRVIKK